MVRGIVAALLFCALAPPAGQGQPIAQKSDTLETLRTREPNWGFPAYFMTAPGAIERAMRAYLDLICDGYNSAYGLDAYVHDVGDADWLCEEEAIHFYRGIDGWGRKMRSGYVCQYELGLPDQRFFSDSRFANYGCIFLYWNQESRGYEIEFTREEE